MARKPAPSAAGDDIPAFGHGELYDLLWQTAAYTLLMGEDALAGTPLTPGSSSMLIAISEEPGISAAEISRRIPKTQQAVSQVAARLEKLGLVERRLRSGRGVGLHVTDAGREMAQVAATREREVTGRLRELLGDERTAALTALLGESREILRKAR